MLTIIWITFEASFSLFIFLGRAGSGFFYNRFQTNKFWENKKVNSFDSDC